MPLGIPAIGGKSLDCKETQAGYPPRMVKRTRLARKLCLLSPCYWGKLRLQEFSAYGFGYSRFWKVLLPKVGLKQIANGPASEAKERTAISCSFL
jgi:hypothetical protein